RAMASAPVAQSLHRLHPLRMQYDLFSDANPFSATVWQAAEWSREHRSPAAKDNPFLGFQQVASDQIVATLDAWRDARDAFVERTFFAIYGAPALQAIAGIDQNASGSSRKVGKSHMHQELLRARIAELKARMQVGGQPAALVRALLYAGLSRGSVDERGFEMVRQIRRTHGNMPLSEFKALVREQYLLLLIDEDAALANLPAMMPPDRDARVKALRLLRQILGVGGKISPDVADRLARLDQLLGTN